MTVAVIEAGEDDRERWQVFVDGRADAHFAHRWQWRDILATAFGHQSRYLMAEVESGVVGVLPLVEFRSFLFGRSLISMPYLNGGGVLAETPEAAVALLARARALVGEMGADYMELRHRAPLDVPVEDLVERSHKVVMTLPLKEDADALLGTFKGKFRNKVRRSSKEGFNAESVPGSAVTPAYLDTFYRVFSRHMRDLGTPVYPKALFEATVGAFGDRCRMIVVRRETEPVAAGITIGEGDRVEIPWASALKSVGDFRHNMLLYWQGMVSGCEDGYRVFDFGRSTPGSGPHKFKTQWGGETFPLHWHYALGKGQVPDVNPDNPKFALLVACWRRMQVALANALGPVLTRSLP